MENVGSSAWGLAIHEQSRLIAVGSNAHEVTVFAFALNTETEGTEPTTESEIPSMGKQFCKFRFPDCSLADVLWKRDGSVDRDFNFKIRFKLKSPEGDNVPSIAFADNEYGEAETIIAKDIKGALWLFNIWEDQMKRLPREMEGPNDHDPYM